jgi:hypothetical protein
MRWWLNTDNKAFSVDNAFVRDGMDFSTLPPNLWMIHWIDGKGEIEYQDLSQTNPNGVPGVNLNGLRENFTDVTPYAKFFQQFLTLLQAQGLTLTQAQKVQTDLIQTLYDSKRQLPFPYTVAAGDFTWPADDGSIATMSLQTMPSVIGSLNTISGSGDSHVNSLVDQINAMIDQVNAALSQVTNNEAQIVDQDNALNDRGASLTSETDAIANNGNANFATINNNVTADNNVISHINNTMFGHFIASGDTTNTLNNRLNYTQTPVGLLVDIAEIPYSLSGMGAGLPGPATGWPYWSHLTPIPTVSHISSPIGTGPPSTISWTPIDSATPVNLSPDEVGSIMGGIAARQQTLNGTKTSKTNAVNALTTIAAVIAYDVTAGW